MSNARKLQTEIDRVMKKVDEGVELFDEIWDKVYSADSQNQKEKHEVDLKKEIKKLQRLRDQIKTWIGGTEVKDKDALVEARKLIETKMEQFKVCEKETKTKTYSKEGLARAEKLDPAEEAKNSTISWIQEYVERMQGLVEEADFEIEKLSTGKGKKSQKKVIEGLQQHIINHRYHISKLEGIIRLVNNDRLDCDTVDGLKDDFDYYLDSYQDDEYQGAYDPDVFYESLGLDELDVVNVDHVTAAAVAAVAGVAGGSGASAGSGATPSAAAATAAAASASGGGAGGSGSKAKGDNDAASSSSKGSKDRKSTKKGSLSSVIPLTIGRARASSAKIEEPVSSAAALGAAAAAGDKNKPTTPSKVVRSSSTPGSAGSSSGGSNGGGGVQPPASGVSTPGASPKSLGPAVVNDVPTPVLPTPSSASAAGGATSMAAILKRETEQQEKERQKLLREQQARAQAEQLRVQQQQQQQRQQQEAALRQQEAELRQQQQQEQDALKQRQQQQQQQVELMRQQEAAKQQQQQAAVAAAAVQQQQQQIDAKAVAQGRMQAGPGSGTSALDILTSGLAGVGFGSSGGPSVGGLGGMSVDSRGSASPVPPSSSSSARAASSSGAGVAGAAAALDLGTPYLSALSDSFQNVPSPSDADRSRTYAPQNPYPTPASYPTAPSPIFSNPAVFEKLGTDCLFFIFYYAQGTYQQYLAARELKKQSWRFHKKYMTWFQRHEEPKITTDEYEQGTYVYFDYETGWCTRIKTDFRFEYSYLEDSLQ